MNREFDFRCGKRFPLCYRAARRTVGPTWPNVHKSLGGSSAAVKRLDRECGHSCPHSAEVMNACSTEARAFLLY
jgi:hypothetical protein